MKQLGMWKLGLDILFIENIANVSYNIAKKLRELGWNVMLLTRENPSAGILDQSNVSNEPWVKTFPCFSLFDKTFRYLSRILEFDVDIIHCHYALEQGLYALFSKSLRKTKKVIIHCHGTDLRDVSRSWRYGWIVNINLKLADKVFVSTPDLLRNGVEFLPNPIDIFLFKPAKPTIDLRMGHDYAIFLPSRHVWKHKRQDLFLKALRVLVDKGYDCNLIMVNYGPDLDRSKILVNELKLKNNVCFVPPIRPSDMPSYYNSSDIVWAQMGLGHLGLVCLEAMACNKPTFVDFIYNDVYPEPPPVIRVYNLKDIIDKTIEILDSKKFNLETRWWVAKYSSYQSVLSKLIHTYYALLSD
jgi:glycosyltransferase involved in cell wall biosynthesis